ncbi:MAG: DAK2 domain-containing protein [Lachnospiraceae bacterium]|nr:DAK2 domain-containing protein [Candidatus Equihabitans merdae]
MEVKQLDALMLQKMFLSGAARLENQKALINELNVFPVPDGDTGTNMCLTISSAAEAVAALQNPANADVTKAISSGALRGARGNSGVILSQLFRGFHKGIKDADELNPSVMAVACRKAVETAYKAVMKPKEGTILTVAKFMADKAEEIWLDAEDIGAFMEEVVKAGDDALAKTPEMLPVLKEAGVVDSGGMGLMTILHGCVDAYFGRETEVNDAPASAEVKYPYHTELIVESIGMTDESAVSKFKSAAAAISENIVIISDAARVKISLDTNDAGIILHKALKLGEIVKVQVRNVKEDPEGEALFDPAEEEIPAEWKDYAFLAVSVGSGLTEIFKELGVDRIIEGGQTMNPSTDDILTAIEKVHAKTVYILPNNKNIILAANQAADLVEDCKVVVVPTKTIPQGISALVGFVAERSPEENLEAMMEEISRVKTGEVTYSVRNTSISGVAIKEGDIMGIGDNGSLVVGSDICDVTVDMLSKLVDDESELISLYGGADFSEEDLNKLGAMVEEAYPDFDVQVYTGGQPVYYIIAAVE